MNNREELSIEVKNIQLQLAGYLEKHWRLFLAEGIFFIILGIGAILIPQFFTEAIVIFLGWLLVFGGAAHLGRALMFRSMPGFGLWLAMGLLQIVAGYLLIADPLVGVLALTTLMTLFFAIEGSVKIALALTMRPLVHWGMVLFSGITSLVIALIIVISWSETAHWLLGVFLGINMIFLGWSLVNISLHHKTSQG